VTPGSGSPTLDYFALRDSLASAGVVVSLAELHGGICGALCAGAAAAAEQGIVDCLADQELVETAAIDDALRELVSQSWRMLDSAELAFAPLLPDDDEPMDDQVQALALWCHGFLGGLGTSAPSIARGAVAKEPAVAGIGEILRDFAEISRAGLSEAEAAGEDQPDFALAELIEYVRVSVQIVFEELAPHRAAAAREAH
jgi:uncharacterized protein